MRGGLSSHSVGGVGARRGDGAARGICNIVKGCVAANGGWNILFVFSFRKEG